MTRFREIERLRGLAIVLAVFNHEPLHELVPWFSGVVGVHLFFVISGFVITLSLLRLFESSDRPLRTFYVRRFFRLFPVAALSISAALACSAWLNRSHDWNQPFVVGRQALAALTLTYNYRLPELGWDLSYFWSLNVEEHFYLVLPALLLAATRVLRLGRGALVALFGALWCVATAVRVAAAPRATGALTAIPFWTDRFSTHAVLDVLLAGALLGVAHHFNLVQRPSATRWTRALATSAVVVAVLGLVFVHKLFSWESQTGWTVVEACSVALVAAASFRRGYVLRIPVAGRIFEYLGARSYCIYLIHMAAWRIVNALLFQGAGLEPALGRLGAGSAYVALVLVVSEASHRLIERPTILAGRRLTRLEARAALPR